MALKIWLPLNGDLENKGISDITVTSGNVAIDNNGKIGQCYLINGTSSYIQCLFNSFNISEAGWSFCFWIYPQDLSRWNCLLSFITANGQNYFYLNKDGTFSYSGYASSTPSYGNIELNKWQHITISFLKTGGFAVYKNGEFLGVSRPETVWSDNLIGVKINSDNSSLFGKFKINDFRIYDHCLSAKEVKEISQGLVLHYKLDGFSGGAGENLAIGTNTADISTNVFNQSNQTGGVTKEIVYDNDIPCVKITRNNTAQSGWKFFSYNNFLRNNIKTSTQYTVSFDIKASVNGTIGFTGLVQGNATNYMTKSTSVEQGVVTQNVWSHIILHCTTKDSFSDITIGSQVIYMSPSASLVDIGVSYLLKNMKLEEGESATSWTPSLSEMGIDTSKIIDSSGYGNDGIAVGSLQASQDSERYGISTAFAASSAINCGRNAMVTDSITVNLWAKYSTFSNLMSCTESGGWNFENNSGLTFPVYVNSVGYVHIDAANRPPVANYANAWHMFTGVYDRLNQLVKLYIDGELIGTGAVSAPNPIRYHATNCIWINAEATGSNTAASYGNAKSISDVRIYATALSAEDILDLYHTPANIDNLQNMHTFEFRENSEKTSIYQNGITSTTNEIHESNAELLNTMSIGGYTPAKNIANSCTNFGYANFDNYASLGKDLTVHIECDVEWTAFTADTGGTFRGVWFQGANYEIDSSSFKWAGTNYICSALNSAFSLQTISTITTAGKHHYNITTTIPASWFATYSRSNLGWRCDYSDGTGHIDIKNLKITPLQYYNAKIGEDFISANNFIEK